uniref:Glycine-rich protein 3 short isoform-like n=1 Tax=Nicotiana tabacum TaxID=4097 RepID=A0A1S3XG82_TOBAC|nr:PREDICTED: glycine-rich protein 3 short isoform-like [Nicotiana tabacum]
MGFKAFIVLSFALAIFVFITFEVAAESSTNSLEISKKSEKKNEVNDAKYPGGYGGYPGGGYGGYPRGGYGGYPGGGYRGYPGGGYGGYPGGGRGGYGGEYCRYGCCGRRDYYGCRRCCYDKREALVTEAKPHN